MSIIHKTRTNFPESWAEADTMWKASRKRKLANNTTLERFETDYGGLCYAVRLHSTNVVTFWESGSVELNTGGWRTVTTKSRMNACGVRVRQREHNWYVDVNGHEVPYEDHMVLTPDGGVIVSAAAAARIQHG